MLLPSQAGTFNGTEQFHSIRAGLLGGGRYLVTIVVASRVEHRSGRIPTAARAEHEATLLAVARELFYRDGFEGVTMEAIARAAHVSPKTIYARYGSKEGIFGAALRARAAKVLATLLAPIGSSDDVQSVLVDFGTRLLTVTTLPEALHMQRLVIAQSVRFPELGREFFEAGPKRGMATLAAFFVRATDAGFMNVADPSSAAEMFCGALLGMPVRSALLRHTRPSRRTIELRANDVVALFLRAYGMPDGRRPPAGRRSGNSHDGVTLP